MSHDARGAAERGRLRPRRIARGQIARGLLAALILCAPIRATWAQTTLHVIDTAPNDVLNVREFPTAAARIVGVIPPDGRGLVPTGERVGPWVFVRYEGVEGWVSSRFVSPDRPPIRRGRRLD